MKKCKKILALFLSVLMVALMVPLNETVIKVSAAEAVDVLLWSPTSSSVSTSKDTYTAVNRIENVLRSQSVSFNTTFGSDTLTSIVTTDIKLIIVYLPESSICQNDMKVLKSFVSGGK